MWKRKGLYNTSNPAKRIKQFLDFIKVVDFEFPFWNLPPSLIILYFEQQYKLAKIKSSFLLNNFLINCVAIFLFWKGNQLENTLIKNKSQQLLQLITPESNRYIRKWKELNIQPKNAFDSQALLEIYQQLCNRKGCVDCEIGKKILTK